MLRFVLFYVIVTIVKGDENVEVAKTETGENVEVLREISQESVQIVLRIKLENGATLLFDDRIGLAEGDDGVTYAPAYRLHKDRDDDVEVVGWCVGKEEIVLENTEE